MDYASFFPSPPRRPAPRVATPGTGRPVRGLGRERAIPRVRRFSHDRQGHPVRFAPRVEPGQLRSPELCALRPWVRREERGGRSTALGSRRQGHVARGDPAGWQVTTAVKGPASGVYRAADYHELADAMTFVGKYSLDSLQADGKWIRIALWPASDYTPAVARNLRNGVAKMAPVQNRIMGDTPYDVYTVFFNVIHGPIGFGGGLEHSASQYDIMPAQAFADPVSGNLGDFMYPLLSHEFFHLWNVKRLRPAEMWPYDYHGEQYTPLLWWSEGVTDYYADITNLRAALWTPEQFLQNATSNMDQVES